MTIKEIEGNLFTVDNKYTLVHCISACGEMGKGYSSICFVCVFLSLCADEDYGVVDATFQLMTANQIHHTVYTIFSHSTSSRRTVCLPHSFRFLPQI